MKSKSTKIATSNIEKQFLYGLVFILLLLITATIILGSVPPVDRDALTHHLFVPKLWLKHGGIYEIPEIPFSYYPMNLDLLYTISLYFGDDIIPKYIHYCFALATALLLYRHIAKRLGKKYGLFGAFFFLSVPIIVKLSITVYVDLGVVFFTTAALLLLLHWAEKQFQRRWLVLAGLCCGFAAGTKYNGLISLVVLTLLTPIIYQQIMPKKQQSNSKALIWGVVFAGIAMTSFSPWLIRNYAWTGNPIYPLHNSLFQEFKRPVIDQQLLESENITGTKQGLTPQGNNAFISRKILYNEPWWQTLLLPVRFFFEGQDDNPQFFDGKLTPFLLLLPTLAVLFRSPDTRQRRETNFLLSFSLLYFFFTFFQEALRIRYIVPIVPPLVILSMYGLHGFINRISIWTKSIKLPKTVTIFSIFCVPSLMLWYNIQYVATQFAIVNPLPYLRGKVSRDAYITNFRPEYPAIQYANAILPPDARVLCIFMGNRGYYMNFHPVFEQPFEPKILSPFFKAENREFDVLKKKMQHMNITHILLRDDLTATWFQQLSDDDQSFVAPLLREASKPLFKYGGYTFYAIAQTALR